MINLTNSDFYNSLFSQLKETLELTYLDFYFSRLMLEREKEEKYISFFIFMYLSMKTRGGDVCIDIYEDHGIIDFLNQYNLSIEDMEKELFSVKALGRPGDMSPIIIDEKRLYLNKYYKFEDFLYNWFKKRSENFLGDNEKLLNLKNNILPKYFENTKETDWQKFAAVNCCLKNFSAVSGGPGTGKTTTVVKIICCLQELNSPDYLKVKLCAPTGKAASRLVEALNNAKSRLEISDEIAGLLPEKARTIHRLLGFSSNNGFRFNKNNKLDADLVIVDEASMVDVRLMSALCSALKDGCRLILLGDMFQLASVSPGSVFGDICGRGRELSYSSKFMEKINQFFSDFKNSSEISCEKNFSDSIVELKKSYRFDFKSGIGRLAQSVKKADIKSVLNLVSSGVEDLNHMDISNKNNFKKIIEDFSSRYFSNLLKSESPEEAFKYFSEFTILSPLKSGIYGVKKINETIEGFLTKRNDYSLYHGKPIMISENDYRNNLFNGDVGIFLKDPENKNELRVFFQTGDGGFKKVHPVRLGKYDLVYSMTVHKSQGSEFDNVFFVMPEMFSNLLSAELFYTAVTRAKKRVFLSGSEDIIRYCVKNRVARTSGLFEKLWNC